MSSSGEITLPAQLAIRVLEEILYSRKKIIAHSKEIKLDFSKVDYMEIGCFFYIMSLVFFFEKKNKKIRIKLPESINIRNIFRIWRFPIVLKELTGIPFKDLVVEDDLKYFGENKSLKGDYYEIIGINEEGVNRLCDKGFFSLSNLPFDSVSNKRDSLISETKRWEDAFIKSVLMKHLKNYDNKTENLLPRIIIYECLTNAYRHPEANSLVTSSFFDKKGNFFTITYWDNGKSILETIKKPVFENKSIKAQFDESRFEDLLSSFYIKYVTDTEKKITVINSNHIPDRSSEDYELLLSTFFPGISSDPEGQKSYFQNSEINVKSPGMGLTYLLKVVVGMFDGTLSVRTNNYFLNFSRNNKESNAKIEEHTPFFKNKYRCKIQYFPNSDCYFIGNMITIRLPLN